MLSFDTLDLAQVHEMIPATGEVFLNVAGLAKDLLCQCIS